MTNAQMWNKARRWFLSAKPEDRVEAQGIAQQHAAHNASVRSRQVVRGAAFGVALADVNQRFGGEPRDARRRMARRLAKAAMKGLRNR